MQQQRRAHWLSAGQWMNKCADGLETLGFVVIEEERGILRVVPAANIETDLEFAAIQLRYVRPTSVFMPFITSEYVRDLRNQQPLQPGLQPGTVVTPSSRSDSENVLGRGGAAQYVQSHTSQQLA